MPDIAVQTSNLSGIGPTFQAAASGGDTFANDGQTMLHVKNSSGAAITVTVNSVTPCDQGFDHDAVVSVPAGGERIIGPFSVARFGTTVGVTYSGVTGLTVAAIKVPR